MRECEGVDKEIDHLAKSDNGGHDGKTSIEDWAIAGRPSWPTGRSSGIETLVSPALPT